MPSGSPYSLGLAPSEWPAAGQPNSTARHTPICVHSHTDTCSHTSHTHHQPHILTPQPHTDMCTLTQRHAYTPQPTHTHPHYTPTCTHNYNHTYHNPHIHTRTTAPHVHTTTSTAHTYTHTTPSHVHKTTTTYSKSSLNRPTVRPTLSGPFREVVEFWS